MHCRLHVGLERIKKLVSTTVDAPPSLVKAVYAHCDDCVTANAKRLPHSGKLYALSYPSKLVHMDIAGRLNTSHVHSFRYVLVLVDDHSRYKSIYLLKHKSDAKVKATRSSSPPSSRS